MTHKKKLIEVALPLEAINKAAAREKSIRHGHPSTLHLWWARRPLAAARAVIFAQMVDDPSAHPDLFPTEKKQEKERQRLFRIIEDLVQWENTTNEEVLQKARDAIWESWRRACAENADHPRARELFNREVLPAFHDPFAGGGALPLEAQRLGLEGHASDLNPVAVLINKAMIEIPPRFAGLAPVNPESRKQEIGNRRGGDALQGTDCLAEGDGSGKGGLPADADVAERGNLRNEVTDYPGGSFDSLEHRRGMGPGVGKGESAIPCDRARLTGGAGHPADALRTDWLVCGEGNASGESGHDRGREDADHPAKKVTLTPTSYSLFSTSYHGAQGLASDVRYYGQWMRDEAEKRIGHLYPKVGAWYEPRSGRYFGEDEVRGWKEIGNRGVENRKVGNREVGNSKAAQDLEETARACGYDTTSHFLLSISHKKLTVIAWLWARTVKSPNPAFANVDVPLASTFMLSTKAGKEAYVEPVIDGGSYRFAVKVGKPKDAEAAKNGTKLARGANFKCVMSDAVINDPYIKAESMAGRMGARLMAIVAEGTRGRVYLAPTPEHEAAALKARPEWKPDMPMNRDTRDLVSGRGYGFFTWADLFTDRQLVALTSFSDLVGEAIARIQRDAIAAGLPDDGQPLAKVGAGATAYAEAVGVYLACGIDKSSMYWSSLCYWMNQPKNEIVSNTFGRQALPMVWDFAESNPFSDSGGNLDRQIDYLAKSIDTSLPANRFGRATQFDAAAQKISESKVVSTDPPYYDNIGYADLSDFFYVWLRRSLRPVFPDLFATMAVPKAEELVATPYRHGSKEKAETFFLDGMTQAMHRLAEQAHPAFPVTIYYAFKQQETENRKQKTAQDETATATSYLLPTTSYASTGWDTFLAAVIEAGFAISGTWPMRTERPSALKTITNALASSIVLVCRPRPASAPTATRRDFHNSLKTELPAALAYLQAGNIAPVDLAQAAIGPGMAVYTRFARVLDAEGKPLTVRAALALINQVLDEALAEQEGDFDADTRWALAWFEQMGFAEGEFGVAEQLSKSKNTAVSGLAEAGILFSGKGKVRLLKPAELPADWDPLRDARLTVWEMVHHLVRVLEAGGESAAAALVAKLGSQAEIARELCYRLYTICERKKRAVDAMAYNALVQSWPEIVRLAREAPATTTDGQEEMF